MRIDFAQIKCRALTCPLIPAAVCLAPQAGAKVAVQVCRPSYSWVPRCGKPPFLL
jgi:hypothetical protein